jgi:hypothetical protein
MIWRKRKTPIVDEMVVLSTVAALRLGELDAVADPGSQVVLDALRRSTGELEPDAPVAEVADYVQGFDEDQLPGLINNVKGIAFELQWAADENGDGDGIDARLHPTTNHPDSDAVLASAGGAEQAVQLKATDSASLVRDAMEDNPDIPVVATSEVAGRVDGSIDGGIENGELTDSVEDTIDALDSGGLNPALGAAGAGGVAAGVQAWPILRALRQGRIGRAQAKQLLAQRCGLSAAKATALVLALNSPLAPAAGAYILYRVARRGYEVVADNCREDEPCSDSS